MTAEAIPGSGAQIAQVAHDFQWDGNQLEVGAAIAASGGGFRAMLFHVGAFMRLNELGILAAVKRISSVSGGSVASGYLAKVWTHLDKSKTDGVFASFKDIYVLPMLAFSKNKIDVVDALTGILPWSSAAEEVAESYNKILFKEWTLQNLPDEPRFIFCATNLQTGVLWRSSKPYAGDYVLGKVENPQIPLARAVAASSAFPPVMSPLVLTGLGGQFKPWPTGPGPVRESDLGPYRERVILSDGGVYDNHGLEPIQKRYTTIFVSDGGAPFDRSSQVGADWISQLKRVLDVTDNQVRSLRRRSLMQSLITGNNINDENEIVSEQSTARRGAYWGIDTDPEKVSLPDALPCNRDVVKALALISTRLSDPGDQNAKRLINWGYAIADRCVRTHYKGKINAAGPKLPFPEAALR
jgi:NTE family protein